MIGLDQGGKFVLGYPRNSQNTLIPGQVMPDCVIKSGNRGRGGINGPVTR